MKIPKPVIMTEDETEVLSVDEVLALKRHDCSNYLGCLAVAAKGNWPQFSCKGCPAYEFSPPSPVELRRLVTLGKALGSLK